MSRPGVILLAVRFLGGPGRRGKWGGIGRGRSRLITAVVGISLSLVPLIVIQQIADGMISGIVARFVETGSYHIQVVARRSSSMHDSELLNELRLIKGVRSVQRERQGYGLLYSATGRNGVTIRSVNQEYWEDDPLVQQYVDLQSGVFDLSQEDHIVLGVHTAERLGVGPGDEVRLLTVKPLGEGRVLPRVSRFTVTGIISTGYRDLDRLWVFVPLAQGVRIIPDETARDIIGIKIDHPFSLPNPLFNRGFSGILSGREQQRAGAILDEISAMTGMDWFVLDWYSLEEGRYVSFLTSRNLLSVVMAMIVVVAAINVSSALVLLVVEKEQEIAILRATGFDAASIGATFVVAGLLIGIAGSVLGTAVGLSIAGSINTVLHAIEIVVSIVAGRPVDVFSSDYYLQEIPVSIKWMPVSLSVFFTLFVATLAGMLPARRASGIRPDHILRHNG